MGSTWFHEASCGLKSWLVYGARAEFRYADHQLIVYLRGPYGCSSNRAFSLHQGNGGGPLSTPITGRLPFIQLPVAQRADSLETVLDPSTVNPSDDEILERLGAGDSDSLVYLFNRYYRLVWTIGMRILRDRSEAED